MSQEDIRHYYSRSENSRSVTGRSDKTSPVEFCARFL